MEEKKYPILDEEECVGVSAEPTVAVAYNEKKVCAAPVLGPSTWEEAMGDLDVSEREFEAGECVCWESVVSELKERYRHYAY